jgi:signal transduction histidine kinase
MRTDKKHPPPQRSVTPDFRLLFESAPGLYLVLTPTFEIVAVSDAYLQATMTTREGILGRNLFDVFPDNPADPAATGVRNLKASLNRVLELRVPDAMAVQKYDVSRPESGGGGFEERYWSPVNSPVLESDGSVAYIIHRVEDVTDFLRLKQQELEQEEQASSLRTQNQRMEVEVFQRAQEIQEANRLLREAQIGLERRVAERTEELARANEALREEIEQKARLEEQMRQAQKMEAVGQLAGGVAHDFNNLLTVILIHGERLLQKLPASDPARTSVEQIKRAGDRAAALTGQLLTFSRQQVLEPKLIDLNAIVLDTEKMLRRVIREDIVLATSLSEELGTVKADPGQIEQILMNLAVNARDAMPRGGSLTFETRNVDLDASYAKTHLDVSPGPYVMLAVSDTGIGMDRATRARIFEPFFTTKELGAGTGLGLATVFGIVKQSGGSIWVYSEPGQGSTFKIYLPRVGHDALITEEGGRTAAPPSGTETILVVEDDEAVREITVSAFLDLGYKVLEAGDGIEAVRLCESHEGPIHLLVSDVVMPGMSGPKVAEAVQTTRPDTRILFLSGYTDDAMVRHGLIHKDIAFLQKPFTVDALAKKVRETLARV